MFFTMPFNNNSTRDRLNVLVAFETDYVAKHFCGENEIVTMPINEFSDYADMLQLPGAIVLNMYSDILDQTTHYEIFYNDRVTKQSNFILFPRKKSL
jgi:hypothetical protein